MLAKLQSGKTDCEGEYFGTEQMNCQHWFELTWLNKGSEGKSDVVQVMVQNYT